MNNRAIQCGASTAYRRDRGRWIILLILSLPSIYILLTLPPLWRDSDGFNEVASTFAPKANSGVPTGVAVYQDEDIGIRHYSEATNTIVRWKEYPTGGHYAVMNAPDVWLKDVQEFYMELL